VHKAENKMNRDDCLFTESIETSTIYSFLGSFGQESLDLATSHGVPAEAILFCEEELEEG